MSAAVTERHLLDRTDTRSRRDTTINLRLPTQTRELIDAAANAVGKTRTEFVIESARQHAIDVLLDQRLFPLDQEQFDAFVHVLDNPPASGAKLKALMKRRPLWAQK